jgi:hypothetical protein
MIAEITLEMAANSAPLSQNSACLGNDSATIGMAGDSPVEPLHDRLEMRAGRDKWSETKTEE